MGGYGAAVRGAAARENSNVQCGGWRWGTLATAKAAGSLRPPATSRRGSRQSSPNASRELRER